MEITAEQFARIEHCLPKQRGNVSMSNLNVLNAILFVAEHGCKWRGLPKRFGNWHTIYTRMNRWSKLGVLDRVPVAEALGQTPPLAAVLGHVKDRIEHVQVAHADVA